MIISSVTLFKMFALLQNKVRSENILCKGENNVSEKTKFKWSLINAFTTYLCLSNVYVNDFSSLPISRMVRGLFSLSYEGKDSIARIRSIDGSWQRRGRMLRWEKVVCSANRSFRLFPFWILTTVRVVTRLRNAQTHNRDTVDRSSIILSKQKDCNFFQISPKSYSLNSLYVYPNPPSNFTTN